MATAEVSKEALEVLQHYTVDLKDFNRARNRYRAVLENELKIAEGESPTEDVTAATHEARARFQGAWQEYLTSAQHYFARLIRAAAKDVLSKECTSAAASSAPDSHIFQEEAPKSMIGSVNMAQSTRTVDSLMSTEPAAAPLQPQLSLFDSANPEAAPVPVVAVPPTATGPIATTPDIPPPRPCAASALSPSAVMKPAPTITTAPTPVVTVVPLGTRAEQMSDFCTLCEKWYLNNETTFELPSPVALAELASTAVASVSRLFRLLGLRIAYLCAGNGEFIRAFLGNPETVRWVALCGDRELFAEVEGLLNLIERLLLLNKQDAKAFPKVPFGWLYRLCSLVDPHDMMPNVPPKRRTQAVRIAIALLRERPDQATAINLHSALLRLCLTKGGATREEMREVIRTIVDLFDAPNTRQYLRLTDLSFLFSPLLATATPCDTPEALAVLNNAKDMIVMVLSSWVGCVWLGSEAACMRSLIDTLHLPGDQDKKMVVIALFNNLLVALAPHRGITPMGSWAGLEDELRKRASDSVTVDSASMSISPVVNNTSALCDHLLLEMEEDVTLHEDFIPTTKALGYHVMDPLLGRVLVMLNYHGLPYALTQAVRTMGKNRVMVEAASALLQDIFVLMETVLPPSVVFSLHEAFNRAVGRLAKEGDAFVGGLTSQLFHSYKASKRAEEASPATVTIGVMPSMSESEGGAAGSANAVDLDDQSFMTMLAESKVGASADYRAWNTDLLVVLVQGPLYQPRRLRVAASALQKLIAFYLPISTKTMFFMTTFSSLAPDKVSAQLCVLGCELMDLLLSSKDGTTLLTNAGYVKAVSDMLKEVRLGTPSILRRDRVNTRVGQTLLRLVGRLSAHANGLVLMRDQGLFSVIDSLFAKLQGARLDSPTEADTLQDVCYQLLQYLYLGAVPNYGVCSEIRYTLRTALSNPCNAIRLCAAMQLKKVVWRDLSTSLKWGIETLVQALHDDFFNVVESAFKLLLSICLCSDEGLDCLISLFPNVLMENELILSHAKQLKLDVLLYRIARRPDGFRFLHHYGWIEEELHRWEKEQSVQYVLLLEKMQGGEIPSAASSPAGMSPTMRSGAGGDQGTHSRSFSDTFGSMFSRRNAPIGSAFLPLLSANAASMVNFFPVHFAAILCSSAEGCATFKHSELWTRSVKRILEQPLPPDIVYDDSLSDESDASSSDESSDGDMNSAKDASRYMRQQRYSYQQKNSIGLSGGGGGGGGGGQGNMNGGGGGEMPMSLQNGGGNSVSGQQYYGTTEGGNVNGSYGAGASVAHYTFAGGMPNSAGATYGAAANRVGGTGANGAGGGAAGGGAGYAYEDATAVSAKEMEALKKGFISSPSNYIISAARGYKACAQSFSLDCVGDILSLKDAMLCVCEVSSTEAGCAMFASVPGLQRRFIALARFASTLSVRSTGMIGGSILARSRRGGAELVKAGYSVVLNPNAYVSTEGVPYAVSFAHMKPSKSMSISRRVATTNTAARHAHADAMPLPQRQEIPKKIWDNVFALANPVSREGSKRTLYKIMKKQPNLFKDPKVQKVCLDTSFTYRLRHVERKFLADLVENASVM